jgi:hypothetical protein
MNRWLETITYGNPNELFLDWDNNIKMLLNWNDWHKEMMSMEDFLDVTPMEKKEIQDYYKMWFILLWDKRFTWEYPEYFKEFHAKNTHLFIGTKEILRYREPIIEKKPIPFPNRMQREFIFVQLHLRNKISQKVKYEQRNFQQVIQQILQNIWITKDIWI